MNIIAAAKRSVNTKNFLHYKVQSLQQIKQFLLHHDLTMSDHQTWSVKLSNKYCILIFLNTVKQSKLRGGRGGGTVQILKNGRNFDFCFSV